MGKDNLLIAPCGIDCFECPAYQATQENERGRLAEILEEWTPEDSCYEPEDLLCDGCHGVRVSRDCRICWIKGCTRERAIPSCAHCGEYPCDRLVNNWSSWRVLSGVEARARLDSMREGLME
ncbi:MAG: DUF3795 domain-containing protein [Candidatus Bathyarchaeota archaeon]|nr:DUF3795 domain-containing protein [Candidatus Bathyarchaeota archaeon]